MSLPPVSPFTPGVGGCNPTVTSLNSPPPTQLGVVDTLRPAEPLPNRQNVIVSCLKRIFEWVWETFLSLLRKLPWIGSWFAASEKGKSPDPLPEDNDTLKEMSPEPVSPTDPPTIKKVERSLSSSMNSNGTPPTIGSRRESVVLSRKLPWLHEEVSGGGFSKTVRYDRAPSRKVTAEEKISSIFIERGVKGLEDIVEECKQKETELVIRLKGIRKVISGAATPTPALRQSLERLEKKVQDLRGELCLAVIKLEEHKNQRGTSLPAPLTARKLDFEDKDVRSATPRSPTAAVRCSSARRTGS